MFGLAYVIIWEGVLAGLFVGTRTFSVRQVTLTFAGVIGHIPKDLLPPPLPVLTALVVTVVLLVGASLLAIRRLNRFEIAGDPA